MFKSKLSILNALNIYLLDIDDINSVYSESYVYEIQSKQFIVRVSESFFGLLLTFTITVFDNKRINYFDFKYENNDNSKKTYFNIPSFFAKNYLNEVKSKIQTYNIHRELKDKDDLELPELEITQTEDDILLLTDIEKSYKQSFYDNLLPNLSKFIETYLYEQVFGYSDLVFLKYEDATIDFHSIKLKFLMSVTNRTNRTGSMRVDSLKFIYVESDVYDKIDFHNLMKDITFKIFYSTKNFSLHDTRMYKDGDEIQYGYGKRGYTTSKIVYTLEDIYRIELRKFNGPRYQVSPNYSNSRHEDRFPYLFENLSTVRIDKDDLNLILFSSQQTMRVFVFID